MTPDLPEHPTDLTREQRQYLGQLCDFIAAPPTLAGVYRHRTPRILASALIFGAGAAAAGAAEAWWAACLVGGTFAGVRLREYGAVTWAVLVWPATTQAIDRRRLALLLGAEEPRPAPPAGRDQLTPVQRGYLADLRRFRAAPPRVAGVLARRLSGLVVPTAVIVVVMAVSGVVGRGGFEPAAPVGWIGWCGLGLAAGIALRDAADLTRAARVWPATVTVADWGRIDDLVGEPGERP